MPESNRSYKTTLVTLLNYEQVEVVLDGVANNRHRLDLESGKEHIFSLSTRPLPPGIHRLVLVFFDDDGEPGLFGWHELVADLYVGANPSRSALAGVVRLADRRDTAVAAADYGVRFTTSPDRLQLVGNLRWHAGLEVYVSVYGSSREDDRPVALAVFQDYQQVHTQDLPRYIVVRGGSVVAMKLNPAEPQRALESLRALLITNPDRDLAPSGTYDPSTRHLVLGSQKAYLARP